MSVRILTGDALTMLRTLESGSVQCVVTSPPYYSLRDYGTATWIDGDPSCDHLNGPLASKKSTLAGYTSDHVKLATGGMPFKGECGKCGAVRVDQQIGLEQTPQAFLDALHAVFDECRRVMRDDAVLFCNLGDSYAGSGKGPSGSNGIGDQGQRQGFTGGRGASTSRNWGDDPTHANSQRRAGGVQGIRPKSLMLIPERFAIGMQDRGWIVRSQIVWAKKSAMPESVRDRPTSAWEPIWMFVKQPRYYWDADAVRQPHSSEWIGRAPTLALKINPDRVDAGGRATTGDPAGANIRNVWHLGPAPSTEAHYASFSPEIPRRCILAATSEKGQCPACGAPWRRQSEQTLIPHQKTYTPDKIPADEVDGQRRAHWHAQHTPSRVISKTTGWEPGCGHDAGPPVPQTVLDPFLGSGTTALVADQLGRNAIGVELSPTYAAMAERRIRGDSPMFASVEVSA